MAITRTQIAKQLLANGGRIEFQGGGMDASQDDFGGGGNTTGGDGDNRDKGREISIQAAQARADAKAAAALGDPDPDVDKSLDERDTITSYANNLRAAFKSRPLMAFTKPTALFTALNVARQAGKARSALGLENPGPPGS